MAASQRGNQLARHPARLRLYQFSPQPSVQFQFSALVRSILLGLLTHAHISWRLARCSLFYHFPNNFPPIQPHSAVAATRLRLRLQLRLYGCGSSCSCDLLCQKQQRHQTHRFQFAIINNARSLPEHRFRICVNSPGRIIAGMAINKPQLNSFYLLPLLT